MKISTKKETIIQMDNYDHTMLQIVIHLALNYLRDTKKDRLSDAITIHAIKKTAFYDDIEKFSHKLYEGLMQ